MTNAQILYWSVAVIVIAAVIFATIIVRRNEHQNYNRNVDAKQAARVSNFAMLTVPAFIVIGICIILYFLMFHFS